MLPARSPTPPPSPTTPYSHGWRSTWERQTGATATFLDKAVEPSDLKGADVVVFPGDRMGDLVDAGVLQVLNDDAVRPFH